MTGDSASASAAAAAASQDEAGNDFPPAAPLLVMLGTIALGVWILFDLDEGKERDHTLDDFVGVLVPTPQIPVSPA